ncbi:MAG TPA: MFS transporter [Methylomirabilota bacterium]|nr:MFS transporter [Methylomirabilota bacterium]
MEDGRAGRRALSVLTTLNALNYADRYVGAAVLPLILAGLALSDAQGGLLQSAFIVTYSLVSPMAGWAGDRYPRLPIAAAGVVIWSIAVIASGLAPTFLLLLLARAVTGVGEAGYAVVTPSLLSDFYPREQRGRAMAIFYAAMPVGTALGYAVGGTVGSHLGWQAAFFVAGAPGLVLALLLASLSEPPRGTFESGAPPAASPLALGASLRALLARPSYVYNTAAQVLYTFAMGGLAVWMPTYFVRERHIPLATAATTFGVLLLIAGFVGTLAGGQLGDRVARKLRGAQFSVSGWSLIASLVFTLTAILAPDPAVYWPAMFGALFLLFLNVGPLNAAMANVLPADLRARGFALTILAIHMLGDAASPWLIGVVSDRVGLTIPVLGAGALLGVSGVVLLAGRNALDRDMQAVAGSAGPRTPLRQDKQVSGEEKRWHQ